MQATQPIGIFDSGIGGLTIANAISSILPHEDIIYFGDTAHSPWGNQNKEAIKTYAKTITSFLIKKQCKAIVIACYTASSVAYQTVCNYVGERALILNSIDPTLTYLREQQNNLSSEVLGLIGTKQTIKSNVFSDPSLDLNIKLMATPLLASLIEEGLIEHPATKLILKSYLQDPSLKSINNLILGCTHYNFLRHLIEEHYYEQQHDIKIIDCAHLIANKLHELLDLNKLLNTANTNGHKTFYSSDYSAIFEHNINSLFSNTENKILVNSL